MIRSLLKRLKPPKEPSSEELARQLGPLPEEPARLALARRAFEAGISKLDTDDVFFQEILVGAPWPLWKELSPLTPAERVAVQNRVQVFARVKQETLHGRKNQASSEVK